jgi:hypothetical protein
MYEPSFSTSSKKLKNKKNKGKKYNGPYAAIENLFEMLNDRVTMLNQSKIFAGVMIIILNISSKFVTVRLSKTMESYLKYTFSRNILIFTIAWMGTREIYIAALITILFIVCIDYLFNEESPFCCLSENFTDYHVELLDQKVSDEDYKRALETIHKYNIQNMHFQNKAY